MKFITWNINGLRSMKKPMKEILDDFACDIVAFQETKISRNLLSEDSAVIEGYTSYFSFPKKQSGYSGVSTFCASSCTPYKAEDGLAVFHCEDETLYEKLNAYDLLSLDSEGRVMISYHKIQVENGVKDLAVINVYCPRVDPEKPERHMFKMEFLHLLEAKAHALLNDGCSVVIMGDINIAHQIIDHCDPGNEEEFNSNEARQWFSAFLGLSSIGESKFVDVYRYLHKDQREAYTCWNTLTGARQTNYGTRIDYILIDVSLLPLLSSCDILPDIQGSDHCPVTLTLKTDAVPSLKLPSICTRLWPEFSGRQQNLLNFCQKNIKLNRTVSEQKSKSPVKPKKSKLTFNVPKQKSIVNFFQTNQKLVEAERHGDIFKPDIESSSEIFPQQSIERFTFKTDCSEQKQQSAIWKTVLCGPPKPPLCSGHQRECVLRTVKKDGPNIGRQFFACAQPNGPASNPESQCDFFKWATQPKRSTLKNT